MERSHRDRTDVFLNLLNIRNIPRDKTLGSPAERLMSRQIRSTLPVNNKLLAPAPKNTEQVNAQLQKKRLIQKQYYDASSHPLQPLAEGQVIRMQTAKGHDRLGIVKEVCREPRSYIIHSDGGVYRRNRRHILPVAEPPPTPQIDPADPHHQSADTDHPDSPPSTPQTLQAPQPPQVILQHPTNEQQTPAASSSAQVTHTNTPYVTRAGRICKPNPKYGQ